MDIEFLDPGPYQPYGPTAEPSTEPPRRRLDAETVGLLVMLTTAALLPVVAAFQTVYTVRAARDGVNFGYAVDGWGRFTTTDQSELPPTLHEPRYGVLLCVCGMGFGILALAVLVRAVLPLRPVGRSSGAVIAGVAASVGGGLTGVTASMALQVETVFDRLRTTAGPFDAPETVQLGVGAAVWLSLAALLAGGLAVAAALRVRRAARGDQGHRPSAVTGATPGY